MNVTTAFHREERGRDLGSVSPREFMWMHSQVTPSVRRKQKTAETIAGFPGVTEGDRCTSVTQRLRLRRLLQRGSYTNPLPSSPGLINRRFGFG